jgi:hypothetical protein
VNAKMETLDMLLGARDTLTGWIVELSSQDPDQNAQLQKLLQRRDRVTGLVQWVVESAFKEAASGLAEAISNLEKATDQLAGLQQTLDNIGRAIAFTDNVVQMATTVIGIATG